MTTIKTFQKLSECENFLNHIRNVILKNEKTKNDETKNDFS